MPVYAGLLALFYDPAVGPKRLFERGKQLNVLLSLILLAALALVFRHYLPPLEGVALLLVVAFGYFIFRAAYVQPELLLYTLLFGAVVCMAHLLKPEVGRRGVLFAIAGGTLAGVAHLTKASVLPLAALFVLVYSGSTVLQLVRRRRERGASRAFVWRCVTLAAFLVCFLGVLYPYISNSKRVFGRYFYNVNTTFYIWYDDWPTASFGTYRHGDAVGWPKMPAAQLPSMRRYLREHTAAQIADRFLDGFRDMVVVNYHRFWIMKFLVLYVAVAVALAARFRTEFRRLLSRYAALCTFLALYAAVYLLAIAFYKPISGTTSRMFLAHVAPLLFSICWFTTRAPFSGGVWRIAGVEVTPRHFHLLVLVTMLLDIVFMLRPRLFADFTGY